MRDRIAACVAALCIGPGVAAGYLVGKPDAPKPDGAAAAAVRFIEAYNHGDAQAMCEMLDARYWYQYWGFVSPGFCLEAFAPNPNDTPLRYEVVGVAHLDGNTAVVTLRIVDQDVWEACDKGDRKACDAGTGYLQLTLELSRRLPSSEYDPKVFAPKKKPAGERVLRYARWQVSGSGAVG